MHNEFMISFRFSSAATAKYVETLQGEVVKALNVPGIPRRGLNCAEGFPPDILMYSGGRSFDENVALLKEAFAARGLDVIADSELAVFDQFDAEKQRVLIVDRAFVNG